MKKLTRIKASLGRGLYKSVLLRWRLGLSAPPEIRRWLRFAEPYEVWKHVNRLTTAAERDLRVALAERKSSIPRISVLMPVYRPSLAFLTDAIEAVRNQIFDQWQLVLVDDASGDNALQDILRSFCAKDSRISLHFNQKNGGISAATNNAFDHADGDIIIFMDDDDLISRDCLAEIAIYFSDHPECDFVYSDHDKIDQNGRRILPHFKPGWSPTLLLSYMYLGHVVAVRSSVFHDLRGMQSERDGSQDYDFSLRATEKARRVGHIPRILYHWRMAPGSTAVAASAKPDSVSAGRDAVGAAATRRGIEARVVRPEWAERLGIGLFELSFGPPMQTVNVVIPVRELTVASKMASALAEVDGIDELIFAGSDELLLAKVRSYISNSSKYDRVRTVHANSDRLSDLFNAAVDRSSSDVLLFLITESSFTRSDWLKQLAGYLQLGRVGAVAPRLVNARGRVISAGLRRIGSQAHMMFAGLNHARPGAQYLARTPHECDALSVEGLLTHRKAYDAVGGFISALDDPTDIGVRYVQSLRKLGWDAVICSNVDLISCGYASGRVEAPSDGSRFYNSNLSENRHFFPAPRRPSLRRKSKIPVLFFSHSLEREGAPIVLFDLIHGLSLKNVVEAKVVSPKDGPLARRYKEIGIDVDVVDMPMARSRSADFQTGMRRLEALIDGARPAVVLANTLEMAIAVNAASRSDVGAILWHHEACRWQYWLKRFPAARRAYAFAALSQAYRTVFVAEETRRRWRHVNLRDNTSVIRHAIPPQRLEKDRRRWPREAARAALSIAADDICVLMIGSICRRKGQIDLVRAISQLPPEQVATSRFFIVGALVQERYRRPFECALERLPAAAKARVTVLDAVDDVALYYRAADIQVCCSRAESAPRVLLEGLSFNLAIITTPVDGIPELVGDAALFYQPAAIRQLAGHLSRLIRSRQEREALIARTSSQAALRGNYDHMIAAFTELICQAAGTTDAPWMALPEPVE